MTFNFHYLKSTRDQDLTKFVYEFAKGFGFFQMMLFIRQYLVGTLTYGFETCTRGLLVNTLSQHNMTHQQDPFFTFIKVGLPKSWPTGFRYDNHKSCMGGP